MPSSRGFSLLLTTGQAADRLGVSVERVLVWVAERRLPIAGQDEDGRALFREHIIDTVGEQLAAFTAAEQRRPRKASKRISAIESGRLPCGCNPARSGFHLCRAGAALNAALQLTEGLAGAIPSDPLLRKLSSLCRDALGRHLSGDHQSSAEPERGDLLPMETRALSEPAASVTEMHA